MRFLSTIILGLFLLTTSQAQNSIVGLGIAYANGSEVVDASDNYISGKAVSLELSGFDLEKSPMEFSMDVVVGNGPEISFSWKLKTAYVIETFEYSFFKVGIGAGEMFSKNYMNEMGLVGLISRFTDNEDDDSYGRFLVGPFLEVEHEPRSGFSFFIRTSFEYYGKSESYESDYEEPRNSDETGLFYAGFKPALGIKFGF